MEESPERWRDIGMHCRNSAWSHAAALMRGEGDKSGTVSRVSIQYAHDAENLVGICSRPFVLVTLRMMAHEVVVCYMMAVG